MALIDCPECEGQVSSFAIACPHCGFPVSESIRQALDEVTGGERAKSIRQLAAANKLAAWADRYVPGSRPEVKGKGHRGDRTARVVIAILAVLVVILQLVWVYSAVGG